MPTHTQHIVPRGNDGTWSPTDAIMPRQHPRSALGRARPIAGSQPPAQLSPPKMSHHPHNHPATSCGTCCHVSTTLPRQQRHRQHCASLVVGVGVGAGETASQVPEVGIALLSSWPLALSLGGQGGLPSPAADVPTGTLPVGAHPTRHALGMVGHVLLVPASATGSTGASSTLVSPVVSYGLIRHPGVVDEPVREHHQPLVARDLAHVVTVRLHGVRLTHAKDGEEHSANPRAGAHSHLQGMLTEAIPVKQIHAVEITAVRVVHPWLAHPVMARDKAILGPLPA